ncbi:GNAT family N-acetyltransferase [Streptomyces roseicoloratus]|uniref:GNAT family N-acetyltransferase n=1 Tax=Streptomyces roseicoloratus TaxID=2508722 RepID=A0ABY9RUN2_9ACTN|nr:GNAT family N-acetyltransferase [Streptomyces roseicoloratus]WMX45907.1 GNAT family N-acetyltransferase [Streptomyces roseicoloratus]
MDYSIRTIRADEWEKVRELRLAALQDPVAHIAFLETYADASAQPDSYWQGRAAGGAETAGGSVRQFVAETPEGRWIGSVTVLVERPSDAPRFGAAAKVDQTHVVGVFVRPEARGAGVTEALFRAAVDWSWSLPEPAIERVRLYVHEDNARAEAFYRKFGFVASGERVAMPGDPSAFEVEYEMRRQREFSG